MARGWCRAILALCSWPAGETVMARDLREECASVYCAVPAVRSRVVRRMVQVCWRWACPTEFCASRAAAGEEPVGSVAAMAAARGVFRAV